jgi:uncharacterized protein (DUF1499 family)
MSAMKKVAKLIVILAVVAVIAFLVMGKISAKGQAPGLVDGRLTRCPDKPNCVCSENREAAGHYIQALELSEQSAENGKARIVAIIAESGGVITSDQADYIAATFTSPLFGFVDDLEIRVDIDAGLIHFRSASRVGYGDLGANRKRVELIQLRFEQSYTNN